MAKQKAKRAPAKKRASKTAQPRAKKPSIGEVRAAAEALTAVQKRKIARDLRRRADKLMREAKALELSADLQDEKAKATKITRRRSSITRQPLRR